jgi:hypothetical protein
MYPDTDARVSEQSGTLTFGRRNDIVEVELDFSSLCWEVRMSSTGWTPTIVPYGADQTLYLVVDRFGRFGSVYRETEVERTDLETIITDLMSGQFNDPVRVVAFNTLEHWSEDRLLRELPKWLVPAPRYTRDLRTIQFLRRAIQFYDGRAID